MLFREIEYFGERRNAFPGKGNGSVVATLQVTEESDVIIITEHGKAIRVHSNEIREAGRSTQGVRLLRLDDDDTVAAAAVLREEQEEEKK
jgi:DNA gyrase subunit A